MNIDVIAVAVDLEREARGQMDLKPLGWNMINIADTRIKLDI